MLDAGGVEVEARHVGLPADGDQQISALDGLLGVAGEHHLHALAERAHPLDLDAAPDGDALALQRVEHDGGAFGVLPRAACPAPAP